MIPRHGKRLAGFLLCGILLASAAGADPAASTEQSELAKLRQYVSEVSARMAELQKQLQVSEKRNQLQSKLIDSLEESLSAKRLSGPQGRKQVREAFFRDLAGQLALSPVYRVEKDHLVVYVDPIFVFRTAEIGAEGEARVAGLVSALKHATESLPASLTWRLHVQGHSDSRPPRGDARFSSNWDLSTARAVAFLHLLRLNGFEEGRMYASGFAATRLAAAGESKADHRKNRRIEVRLELSGGS